MEYRVTWVIDVEADTPRDAAARARQAQTRPDTTATVFEVQRIASASGRPIGETVEVDLSEGDASDGMRQCLGVCFGHGPAGSEAVYCDGRCNPDRS